MQSEAFETRATLGIFDGEVRFMFKCRVVSKRLIFSQAYFCGLPSVFSEDTAIYKRTIGSSEIQILVNVNKLPPLMQAYGSICADVVVALDKSSVYVAGFGGTGKATDETTAYIVNLDTGSYRKVASLPGPPNPDTRALVMKDQGRWVLDSAGSGRVLIPTC